MIASLSSDFPQFFDTTETNESATQPIIKQSNPMKADHLSMGQLGPHTKDTLQCLSDSDLTLLTPCGESMITVPKGYLGLKLTDYQGPVQRFSL